MSKSTVNRNATRMKPKTTQAVADKMTKSSASYSLYNAEEAATRMNALVFANSLLRDRVFEFFQTPHTLRNAEELAALVLNWAKTGKSTMEQIAENQAKAVKLQEVNSAKESTPQAYG